MTHDMAKQFWNVYLGMAGKDGAHVNIECSKKMDAEISKLGPGIGPIDCFVQRKDHEIPVK